MTQFAMDSWQRALEDLWLARKGMLKAPNRSASCSYYAVFHAATAYFVLQELSFKKHTDLQAAVHRDRIRKGIVHADFGQQFRMLVRWRGIGDFGGIIKITEYESAEAIAIAELFLQQIHAQYPELFPLPANED